jgi:hypothetical protein
MGEGYQLVSVENLQSQVRQMPGGFDARIAPLTGLGNGKSRPLQAPDDRNRRLHVAPGRSGVYQQSKNTWLPIANARIAATKAKLLRP